jgi:hypothetical protein
MATGPYTHCAETTSTPIPAVNPTYYRIHIVARGSTPGLPGETEQLLIDTNVRLPFPHHPQGSLLAALTHVRALIEAQIRAIESP